MKANALRHLLAARLRKLRSQTDADEVAELRAILESMRVEHTLGWYQIEWRRGDRPLTLSVPDETFHMYVVGDRTKHAGALEAATASRGTVQDYNWRAALELWGRIAEVSGLAFDPVAVENPELEQSPIGYVPLAALAVVVGALALVRGGPLAGIAALVASGGLLALAAQIRSVHLRSRLTVREALLVLAGLAILAAFVPTALPVLAAAVAAASIATLAERVPAPWSLAAWAAAGAAAGLFLPVLIMQSAGIALSAWVGRARSMAAGLVIHGAAGMAVHVWAPELAGGAGTAPMGAMALAALVTCVLLVIAGIAVWTKGVMRLVLPWWSIATMVAFVGAAFVESPTTAAGLGVIGYAAWAASLASPGAIPWTYTS